MLLAHLARAFVVTILSGFLPVASMRWDQRSTLTKLLVSTF